ncbi:hypothetical protein PGQ11_011057 [Apiospora arundinis]|uniref:Uncharacterized protein n=1 Tax=Apiospora arundinis TaxID=335852 RepID=A0ABR2HYP1_9PEZI
MALVTNLEILEASEIPDGKDCQISNCAGYNTIFDKYTLTFRPNSSTLCSRCTARTKTIKGMITARKWLSWRAFVAMRDVVYEPKLQPAVRAIIDEVKPEEGYEIGRPIQRSDEVELWIGTRTELDADTQKALQVKLHQVVNEEFEEDMRRYINSFKFYYGPRRAASEMMRNA